jgi:hypothetical protein
MVGDHRRGGGPGAAFWFGQEDTSERSGNKNLPPIRGIAKTARLPKLKEQKLTAD